VTGGWQVSSHSNKPSASPRWSNQTACRWP
jgi:hypothetical protein